VVLTRSVIDNNATGATFQGELVKEGLTPTTSYGFIWNSVEPNISRSYKVIVGTVLEKGVFKCRISSSLCQGVDYYIKAFATYDGKTVLGNTVLIHSKGIDDNPWSRTLVGFNLRGWAQPFGSSNDHSGHVLYPNGIAYTYDPDLNKFSASTEFPVSGNSGTRFTSINLDNDQYFFSDINRNLYKLSDDKWSVQSTFPFNYGNYYGFYHGYTVDGNILILSSYKSYIYFPKTNTWEERATLPENLGYSIGGTDLNGKAYIMTASKNICEYDPKTDGWKFITKWSGFNEDHVCAFSYQNKLYFGFKQGTGNNKIDKELWSYDLATNEWKLACLLPVDVTYGSLFSFRIKDNFYFATSRDEHFDLYKLDMSKLN